MNAGRSAPIQPEVYEALSAIMVAHKDMAIPTQVGRRMAVKPKSAK